MRSVAQSYRGAYDRLMTGGLYEALIERGLLIPHEEIQPDGAQPEGAPSGGAYKILRPERVPFISYAYEWCFSALKDAALATLEIQRLAMERGMTLKDASAYNIQFLRGKPILIDTLSFEPYVEGRPWVAYRQFCQHFLAPLLLMVYRDVRLSGLARLHIDGVPLDLARALLPFRTRFRPSIAAHIHLHARLQGRASAEESASKDRKIGKLGLLGIIDNLQSLVRGLRWEPRGGVWTDYYDETNYDEESFENKRTLVQEFLDSIDAGSVWDLGANTGVFSRLASRKRIPTISIDGEPAAVESNYLQCRRENETHLLPLTIDLTNPSPSIGWRSAERMSLLERGPAGAVMALALIHHLAIGDNVPFDSLADFFADLAPNLIIEFVPKSDSQVKRMLASREDIFDSYDQESFERVFARRFELARAEPIGGSLRRLYLMKKREA